MKLYGLIPVFLLMLCVSCKDHGETCTHRLTAQNRLIGDHFDTYIDISWNRKNLDTLSSVLVENFICHHNGIRVVNGRGEMQAFMKVYVTGFPDLRLITDATHIIDRQVVTHWTFYGTHTGVFGQMAATGKKIKVQGYATVRFDDKGKIVQEDIYYNELDFVQQLGYTLLPPILK